MGGSLSPNTDMYWKVIAKDSHAASTTGDIWHFRTAPPTCYALSSTHSGSGSDPAANPANSTGCPAGQYVAGAAINVTASPASGWRVGNWSGTSNNGSTSASNSFTMPASTHTVGVTYVVTLTNDDIAAATAIGTTPYQNRQDNISSATSAPDDPVFPCRGNAHYQTVWYRFIPSSTGNVTIDTFGSDYDTVLGVWTGTRGALQSVPNGCNDDAPDAGGLSRVVITFTAGVTYYIEIASYYSSSMGSLQVNISAVTGQCYTLTRAHTGSGGDPIASPTNSTGCPTGQYVAGASINLTASLASGWRVGSWSGTSNNGSTSASNSFTMPASTHTVGVNYVEIPPADITPPSGRITSPSNNATVATCPLRIVAEASDAGSGVAWVRFWADYDGQWREITTDTSSLDGWTATWDCAQINNQQIRLTTWMEDRAGNQVWDPGGYVYVTLNKNNSTDSSVRAFVRRFYQQCLNREPDQGGWDNWTNALVNGSLSGADLAEAFIFSDEFIRRQTSNAEFLNIMYRAFFNREPDAGGYNAWLAQLNSGTSRADVLYGFTHSQEFTNLCNAYGIRPYMSQQERVQAFVTRFYQQCLNRLPDPAGLAAWTNNLLSGAQTGADVAQGFIFSAEFANRNTSNAEFLTIMYRAFFAREPDSGGYTAWLNALNGGTSRAAVLDGFTHSTEFANLCRIYGIRPF